MTADANLQVEPGVLDAAAAAVRDAGRRMGAVELAADADEIASAMPSSRTAAAASALSASWTNGTQGWAQAAQAHGDAIADASASYTADDVGGAHHIRGVLGQAGAALPIRRTLTSGRHGKDALRHRRGRSPM